MARRQGNGGRAARAKGWAVTAALMLALVGPAGVAQGADTLGQILKLFGIGYAVKVFGPQLNQLINTLTLNHGVAVQEETKVVPILTVGTGAYIGAAQVSGPKDKVAQVEAVAQLEGEFFDRVFRAKVLVPIDNLDITKGFKRVNGVGISALLDLRL